MPKQSESAFSETEPVINYDGPDVTWKILKDVVIGSRGEFAENRIAGILSRAKRSLFSESFKQP